MTALMFVAVANQHVYVFMYFVMCCLQFLSHPLLSELLTEEDQKVFYFFGMKRVSVLFKILCNILSVIIDVQVLGIC